MGDDHAAARDAGRDLGQPVRDVLVRQAMKAVAAEALDIELLGKGIAVGDIGVTAVESGVEAADLQKLWLALPHGPDRGEIVPLVRRSERRKRVEPREYGIVDDDGFAVVRTAMHDAMTDRRRQFAQART